MKRSNPDCNRGIGLVAYRRDWFSKRRYCSKHCRDAFMVGCTKTGAKRVIVSMQHAAKGKSKIDAEMHVAAHLRALDRSRDH